MPVISNRGPQSSLLLPQAFPIVPAVAGFELYTTDGTWVHPNPGSPFKALAVLIGGGGGGGRGTGGSNGGGGGGSGRISFNIVTLYTNQTIVIGAGGGGGNSNSRTVTGSSGGTTSFGSLSAAGGSCGYDSGAAGAGHGGSGGFGGGGGSASGGVPGGNGGDGLDFIGGAPGLSSSAANANPGYSTNGPAIPAGVGSVSSAAQVPIWPNGGTYASPNFHGKGGQISLLFPQFLNYGDGGCGGVASSAADQNGTSGRQGAVFIYPLPYRV